MLVSMRTKLKNWRTRPFRANGIALMRAAFASRLSRARLMRRDDLPAADLLALRACLVRLIEQLDAEIEVIEEEVRRRGKTLRGVRRLLQAHGLNLLSAISLFLKKELDYWYLEDRLYNRKLRALEAAA